MKIEGKVGWVDVPNGPRAAMYAAAMDAARAMRREIDREVLREIMIEAEVVHAIGVYLGEEGE